MRKIFTLFAAAALTLSMNAQGYEGNKFFDNWSLSIQGGATTTLTGGNEVINTHKAFKCGKFFKGARAVAGAELTKMIVPAFGLSVQDHIGFNWTDSKTAIDYNDLVLLAKVNFTNFFAGYTGTPRFFEIEGYFGGGWRYYFNHDGGYVANGNAGAIYDGTDGPGRDSFIAKTGLNLLFNLGEKKAWTIEVKPAVIWDLDGFQRSYPSGFRFDVNDAQFELTAGLTYHFMSSNGYHHFTKVRPYDQAEVDRLNARINALEDENEALRNRKPEVVEKIVEKEVVKEVPTEPTKSNTLETNVYFPISKSVIPASQVPSVERVASYMKRNPNSEVVIRGYASKDGPEDFNIQLGKDRAAAVKNMLVNKYGISASRIDAQGNGISEMFSEPEWNRVSICTIDLSEK